MSEAPQEFESLKQLLKLKRHEMPPPGYFNNFATVVCNGIEREARVADLNRVSWVHRIFSFLETNPISAGIFGVGVCGLLAFGITFNQERNASELSSGGNLKLDVAENNLISNLPDLETAANHTFASASLDPVFGGSLSGSSISGIDQLAFQPINFSLSH